MTYQLFACSAGAAIPLVLCAKLHRQGGHKFENFAPELDEAPDEVSSLREGRSKTITNYLPKSGRKQSACSSSRCWRGRRRTNVAFQGEHGWSFKIKEATMAHPDLELARLEEVLRQARDRLALIIRMISDPAVVKAAEEPLRRSGRRSWHV